MDWVLLSLLNATPSNDNVEELSTDYKFATAFIFLHLCYPNATNSDMNANVYYSAFLTSIFLNVSNTLSRYHYKKLLRYTLRENILLPS